jgi:hypothetical protein
MIISHRHRFIFIKTAKTAGTSIETFFSPHGGPDDVFTPTKPPVSGHRPRNWKAWFFPLRELFGFDYEIDLDCFVERRFLTPKRTLADMLKRRRFHEHIPARIVRQRVPREVWKGYFKFAVERNPWDKTLSHYHMQRSVRGGDLTLDEYFDRGVFCQNMPLYCDERDEVLVDEVIDYDDLAAGIGRICARFGIPYAGDLGVRAKGDYRTDRRHYSEVLKPKHLDVIERIYRKEIDMHGFRYEDRRAPEQRDS